MALAVDNQQPNFKHFCRICKKGFGCGRALGGHMRAHGIGDEDAHIDDDDHANYWDGKNGQQPSNKRMYELRTNPNRLKSCRVCEHCGKEFSCWKSFLSHDGKCSSEDAESLVLSDNEENGANGRRGCGGWLKRKRTLRMEVGTCNSTCQSSEDKDIANCLMMLSYGNVETETEESCASASKEEDIRYPLNFMASMVSKIPIENKVSIKGLFECKACKKVFTSHQALGGHRASHKKVKGCYASKLNNVDDSCPDEDAITNEDFFPSKSTSTLHYDQGYNNASMGSPSKKKCRVHECSICHRVFSSGQALGGHKRCHWITSNAQEVSTLSNFHQFHDPLELAQPRIEFKNFDQSLDLKLDLNLPAPTDNPTGLLISGIKVSTDLYLHSSIGGVNGNGNEDMQNNHYQNENENENENDNNENGNSSIQNVEDEADIKVKLSKLTVLKDINESGCSTPWLQVGVSSGTDLGIDP